MKDGTSKSRSGGSGGSVAGVSAADLERGYSNTGAEKTPRYDDEADGAPFANDPTALPEGGVAGRPLGWAR